MDSTPPSLLDRLRRPNEHAAWERFVELYTPLIYYWARRAGLNAPDASDLVQDVFTMLVEKMPHFQYDPTRSFRAWLRTVTLNKWREKRRRRTPGVHKAGSAELADLPAADDPPELDDLEFRQHVIGRAARLIQAEFEPATWQAFWEYVGRGRPPLEVAAELGTSTRAVYIAKCRVMRRLRQELAGLMD